MLLMLYPAGAAAGELASIDAGATSGDPVQIRAAISEYEAMDTGQVELQWRLIRAYYNLYDELAERDRRDEQRWAAETGYRFALQVDSAGSKVPELVYYATAIKLCYLDFHRVRALFLIGSVLDGFKRARQLDPSIDDAGPDRNLGILYHELPFLLRDRKQALKHLERAYALAPMRAANRLPLAMALVESGRTDEAKRHLEFLRRGDFTVSSEHWRAIYQRRVDELAERITAKETRT
jgi:tetratricopeptide (TPR) repeat protein